MADTSALTPHTYEDMTSFDETQHPRTAHGTFTEKAQSGPEFGLEPADVVPHLEPGETAIFSHADGEIDAQQVGFEGFEVTCEEDGTLSAAAYTDADFHHLAFLEPTAAEDPTAWLDANKDAIARAVATTFPGLRLDDRNGDWEIQALVLDLTPKDGTPTPTEPDGLIAAAKASPTARDLTGPEGFGATSDQQAIWGRVHSAMVAETITVDERHAYEEYLATTCSGSNITIEHWVMNRRDDDRQEA